jgi:uncharacterized membrane protein YeaQ/YmgE (transglycosylase-associated protein family)
MSATIINLIIQLIAGAVGGNAVGAASKDISLGTLGNTIAGAVGASAVANFWVRLFLCWPGQATMSTLVRSPAKRSGAALPVRLSRPSSA